MLERPAEPENRARSPRVVPKAAGCTHRRLRCPCALQFAGSTQDAPARCLKSSRAFRARRASKCNCPCRTTRRTYLQSSRVPNLASAKSNSAVTIVAREAAPSPIRPEPPPDARAPPPLPRLFAALLPPHAPAPPVPQQPAPLAAAATPQHEPRSLLASGAPPLAAGEPLPAPPFRHPASYAPLRLWQLPPADAPAPLPDAACPLPLHPPEPSLHAPAPLAFQLQPQLAHHLQPFA